MAFPCPSCGSTGTRVSTTEHQGYRIKRYIRCSACDLRFRTLEQLADPAERKRRQPRAARASVNRGEANPAAVLTAANVRDIRAAISAGESQRSIARRYGLAPSHVCRIAKRQIWRNL